MKETAASRYVVTVTARPVGPKEYKQNLRRHVSRGSMTHCLNYAADWATRAGYQVSDISIGRILAEMPAFPASDPRAPSSVG